jgi:predicted transcriptional regulator
MPHLKLSQDLRPVSDLERQTIQNSLQEGVDEAERDFVQGNWIEHSEIEAKLRQWSTSPT